MTKTYKLDMYFYIFSEHRMYWRHSNTA